MTVGWERAAALQERESRRRSDRRAALRAGRRPAEWEVQEVSLVSCVTCGELTADAYLSAEGEVCEVCVAEAELSTALAPPSWIARAVLMGGSLPAWGLSALLYSMVDHGSALGIKAAVAVFGLGLFAAGWGAWTILISATEIRADRRHGGVGWRTLPAFLGAGFGGGAAAFALVATALLVA